MDFFSSLKTAYDSIGSEVSKTFDSSDFESDSASRSKTEPVAVIDPEETSEHKTKTQPSDEVLATQQERNNESWGKWEEKTTPNSEVNYTPSERPSAVPVATSTPAKSGHQSKGKLESLSREDLIKYIKKQAQLLQKSKTRCEELTRECEQMKTTHPPGETTPTNDSMLEELQIVRSERDQAVREGKSLKQDNQELSDQVHMLTEANSKLKAFCQETQKKQTEMEEQQRASQEITTQFSQENSSLTSQLTQLRGDLEAANDEKRTLEAANEEKRMLLDAANEEKRMLEAANEERILLLETVKEEKRILEAANEERRTLEAVNKEKSVKDDDSERLLSERTAQLSTLETKHTHLLTEYQELKNRNETLTKECSDFSTRIDELQSQYQQLEKDTLEKTKEELEATKLTISDLKGQLMGVKGQLEATKNEKRSAQDSHKEETKKLKAYVLKLKRELKEAETASGGSEETLRTKMEEDRVAIEAAVAEKQELTSKLSTLEELNHSLEEKNKELLSSLGAYEARLEEVVREREALTQRVSSLEEGQEVMRAELASAQADLATAQSHATSQQVTVDKLHDEVQCVGDELVKEQQAHSETRDQLTAAQKGAQSSALMDLELQDYQRSIKSLEDKVAGKGVELEAAHKENLTYREKIEQLKKELGNAGSQRDSELETVSKLKALLVRNKKELVEGRKKEAELSEKVNQLEAELEKGRGQEEETKIELSELSAQLHSEQLASQSSLETLQQTLRAHELKIATLQSQLSSAQTSLTLVQGDYDSYKVRVHSVLKQKSTPAGPTDINPEIKKSYEDEIVKLKTMLQETKSQLTLTLSDHDELLSEHDALASRHDNLLQEAQATRERLSLRLKETESVYSRETEEKQALVEQLRKEIDDLTGAFTNQITGLQQEHKKVVLGLREELHSTHTQLSRLQEEADTRTLTRTEARGVVKGRGLGLDMPSDGPPSETRTSGVGMDRTVFESSNPSTPLSRQDSTVSLERLLSINSENNSTEQRLSDTELALQKQLHSSNKKIDHLTELLRESEASSGRLSEQAKLLKEEIRRLERNREREGISNMEYLKNVILKFLHTQDMKEKEGLVPVVTKLLQLSPQEVKFVQEVIQGEDMDLPGAAVGPPSLGGGATSKLTNYIHRWTGY